MLNKCDLVTPQQLMRVYGALMWSLGKVLDTPEVVRVYIGSFWDRPYVNAGCRDLFNSEEHDLFAVIFWITRIEHYCLFNYLINLCQQDLKTLPRHAALRKLNDFIKRARGVKIQALIISELAKRKPSMFGNNNMHNNY